MKFLERGSFSGSLPELNRFHDTVPLTKESRPFDLKSLFTLTSTLTARFLSGHLSLRHLPLGGRLFLGGVVAFGSVALEKASAQTIDLPNTPHSSYSDVVSDAGVSHSALSEGLTLVLPDPNSDGGTPAVVEPGFELGFKALVEEMAKQSIYVGKPLSKEQYQPNGDSLLMTEEGLLLVWRKGDNWTAATNGSRTWINGPLGLQERGNDERFEWEELKVAGIQATPAPGPAPTQESRPTPTPEATAVPAPKLDNIFQDSHNRVERRRFTPDQIPNIHGIEIYGKELIDKGYAKEVFARLERDPQSLALVKKYVRSLEVYTATDIDGKGNHVNPRPGVAINDTLGDGANFVSAYFNLPMPGVPNEFFYEASAADLVFEVMKTAIAEEKGNLSLRYQMPRVSSPQLQKERQILEHQALKEAADVAAGFAIRVGLRDGIVRLYQDRAKTAAEELDRLLQNK